MAEVQPVLANSFAKVHNFFDMTKNQAKNRSLDFPIVTFATTNNKEPDSSDYSINFAARVITIKLVGI